MRITVTPKVGQLGAWRVTPALEHEQLASEYLAIKPRGEGTGDRPKPVSSRRRWDRTMRARPPWILPRCWRPARGGLASPGTTPSATFDSSH
ncbi:MAG TPA: hypothetical protein VNS63_21225 [Blastocatellia bacterium]|nr:hypothetical protein [Blastocatellia bacterium]